MLPPAATAANCSLVMVVSHAAHASPHPEAPHTRGARIFDSRPSWSLVRISARRASSSTRSLAPSFPEDSPLGLVKAGSLARMAQIHDASNMAAHERVTVKRGT
jgi:hypothetical protein